MKQYVTLDKRSKKAQRQYYAKQRTTWGELNPVTRSVPSGKTYNRKKEKQRIGVEFRNGFDADFLRSLVWKWGRKGSCSYILGLTIGANKHEEI